jgi:uncharacterized surface protein with fasciclin (FAS1) repeats
MKMLPFFALAALAMPAAFGADAVPSSEKVEIKVDRSVMGLLNADGRYKILVDALTRTGLDKTLDTAGPSTFFAPTDEAFQRVPKLADLLADDVRMKQVLSRHLITQRRLDTAMLRSETTLVPMQGETLKVKSLDALYINDAKVVHPNNDTKTSLVHGIDHVLMDYNDSVVRETGETIERGVKKGADKVHDGLKKGANTIKSAFD